MMFLILILCTCAMLLCFAVFMRREDYRLAPPTRRRAAFNRALLTCEQEIQHFQQIRAGIEQPENRIEAKVQTMTDRQFAEFVRDTYELFGLHLHGEMYYTAYLRGRERYDVLDDEGNVIYFQPDKKV